MKLVESDTFWFPGRWIGGISLLISPLLLLAGGLARLPFNYFFPEQLQAFVYHPTQILVAYNLFLAGNILLFPAILTLTHRIGRTESAWALWGGTFVMLGLFARTFHYGINHLAFQLVTFQGLTQATKAIASSYGAFHIVSVLSAAILFGWIILAIGAYRSRTLSLLSSLSLGLMSLLMLGVLKGSSSVSILALSGLCIALMPLGIDVLKSGSWPGTRNLVGWLALVVGILAFMYFLGQAG